MTAAIFGFIFNSQDPGKYFYRLLEMGSDSDRWINLFNTHDHDDDEASADKFIKTAESIVLTELEKGVASKSTDTKG